MPKPLRGVRLLHAAVKQIVEHPETWNQKVYHCGSKHCVAGWCQIFGKGEEDGSAFYDAMVLAQIGHYHATWLFAPERTLDEIVHFTNTMILGHGSLCGNGGCSCGGKPIVLLPLTEEPYVGEAT